MRFFKWIANLFKKQEAPVRVEKPEQIKPEPIEKPVPTPEPVPMPIAEEKDTHNDGSPARPDWTYLWDTCLLDYSRLDEIAQVCRKIVLNMGEYKAVQAATGVNWKLVAAIHYRESTLNFKTCLHNGDPLPGPTRKVPKGRGPFKSWHEAAIDALKYDGLHLVKMESIPAMLVVSERFNGLGYRKRGGEYSPYVWAGTNHHDETGKYVVDGKYDPTANEKQLGVAAIIKGLERYA